MKWVLKSLIQTPLNDKIEVQQKKQVSPENTAEPG